MARIARARAELTIGMLSKGLAATSRRSAITRRSGFCRRRRAPRAGTGSIRKATSSGWPSSGRSRELGFTLGETRNLLDLVEGGYTCGEVKDAALAHLKDIRSKIADLRRMERSLAETAARCEGGVAPDCPIMDALFAGSRSGRCTAP